MIYTVVYATGGVIMQTARIFLNGRSQAVGLPKECRFSGKEVYIRKFEGVVMLMAKDHPWASMLSGLERFSDDFLETRNQPPQQKRNKRG